MTQKITASSDLSNIDDIEEFMRYSSILMRQMASAINSLVAAVQSVTTTVTNFSGNTASANTYVTNSSGLFVTSSGGSDDVTNLLLRVQSPGGAIRLWLQPDGTGGAEVDVQGTGSTTRGLISILRDGVTIASFSMAYVGPAATVTDIMIPPASFYFVDRNLAAGTYTYKVQAKLITGTFMNVVRCILVAEILT